MLEPEEAGRILAAERRGARRRLALGIPVVLLAALVGWSRLGRWGSGDAETNALILGAVAVVVIAGIVWLNLRWLTRVRRQLDAGELAQVQGEVALADESQLKLGQQRFRVARILAADAKELRKGDRVELDYLPGMRLVIRLRKLPG